MRQTPCKNVLSLLEPLFGAAFSKDWFLVHTTPHCFCNRYLHSYNFSLLWSILFFPERERLLFVNSSSALPWCCQGSFFNFQFYFFSLRHLLPVSHFSLDFRANIQFWCNTSFFFFISSAMFLIGIEI